MSEHRSGALRALVDKINLRSIITLYAGGLGAVGCLLIYKGVRDVGALDVKVAVFEGHLQTGMVGVLIVGVAWGLCHSLLHSKRRSDRLVEVHLKDGQIIRLSGDIAMRDTVKKIMAELRSEKVGD